MRFALMIEAQQGLSYADQLVVARRAEAAGFEAMFRSDHFLSFPGPSDNPTTDAWTVLAGLARETTTLGLGVLVSPVTFRHAGHLAKVAITVDEMSGGRVEVGVGAGWNDGEHAAYGLRFPDISERADMLEETLRSSTASGRGRTAGPSRARTGRWMARCSDPSPRASPSVRRAARPGRVSWSAGAGRRGPSGLPPDSPTSST